MKKSLLTTVIFFTFFSGSPKNIKNPTVPTRIYEPESELIIKAKELNSTIDSLKLIWNE